MSLFSPIAISISPNVQPDDLGLTWSTLFNPFKWKHGASIGKLESAMAKYLKADKVWATNSGRSAEYTILKALGVKKGDEVIMQSYTCVAVAEPILWLGAKPVYVDIDKSTFNMNVDDLKKKITKKTKAIIVQHTFGLAADLDGIIKIAAKKNIPVIEDCAHALGAEYKGHKVGTVATAGFYSFGRDKVISSVYGGAIVARDKELADKITTEYEQLSMPGILWIKKQLLHPILTKQVILPTYYLFRIGFLLFILFQKLGLLSKAVVPIEWTGGQPKYFPARLPNALARLALHQFKKLDKYNARRIQIAAQYDKDLFSADMHLPIAAQKSSHIYLRYTVLTPSVSTLYRRGIKNRIFLGDWYTKEISPGNVDLKAIGYKVGSCPVNEEVVQQTLNLPTNPTMTDAEVHRVITFVKAQ